MIKTTGGYYVFYKVTKVRTGSFSTWEDFLNSVKKQSSVTVASASSGIASNVTAALNSFTNLLAGKAYADSGTDTTCTKHWASVSGTVTDSVTGKAISGANVHMVALTSIDPPGHKGYPGNCGNTTPADKKTDSSGKYSYPESSNLDCVYFWTETVTKTGYEKLVHGDGSNNDLNNSVNTVRSYQLHPQFTLNVNIVGSGSGTVKTPSGGIVCSYNGIKKSGDCSNTYISDGDYVHTSLTASATTVVAGSTFIGFSGTGVTGTTTANPLDITMDRDRTITATFTKITTATLKTLISPGGAATPAADQTATTTSGSVTKTASFTGVNSAYNPIPTWTTSTGASHSCTVSSDGKTATYTFDAQSSETVTCTAYFSAVGTEDPMVKLDSPPSPGNNTTVTTNTTKLQATLSVPGYKSGSGGSDTLTIVYYYTDAGGITHVTAPTTGCAALPLSGVVDYPIDTAALVDGATYTWYATGKICSGSPMTESGVAVTTNVITTTTSHFTYVASSNASCSVSPAAGSKPLTVSVSLVNGSDTKTYTIDFGDGSTPVDDLAKSSFPYYYTYSSSGTYGLKIITDGGASSVCNQSVTVSGSSGGSGGEVTP